MKLICPICSQKLERHEKQAVCLNNHSFDYAKQGYLNLLLKQSVAHGDNKNMVIARTEFLNTDSYSFLRDQLKEICMNEHTEVLADLGCGEGYYTSVLPGKEKYGFDLSKDALKHASKNDPTSQYIIASIFHLPLEDACADTVLTCFAPASTEEINRILKPNGIFIFVTPGPKHLFELKSLLYQTPYENETDELEISLVKEKDFLIQKNFHVEQKALRALFEMTPYAYHTLTEDQHKLDTITEMDMTAEFRIRVFRKTTS